MQDDWSKSNYWQTDDPKDIRNIYGCLRQIREGSCEGFLHQDFVSWEHDGQRLILWLLVCSHTIYITAIYNFSFELPTFRSSPSGCRYNSKRTRRTRVLNQLCASASLSWCLIFEYLIRNIISAKTVSSGNQVNSSGHETRTNCQPMHQVIASCSAPKVLTAELFYSINRHLTSQPSYPITGIFIVSIDYLLSRNKIKQTISYDDRSAQRDWSELCTSLYSTTANAQHVDSRKTLQRFESVRNRKYLRSCKQCDDTAPAPPPPPRECRTSWEHSNACNLSAGWLLTIERWVTHCPTSANTNNSQVVLTPYTCLWYYRTTVDYRV